LVVTSSVEGDSPIVVSSACGSREIASNVVAASASRRTLVWASGATVPMKPSSEVNSRVS
jgi:hypothetical protein